MNETNKKSAEALQELGEWTGNPKSIEDYTIYGIDKINGKLHEPRIPKSILNAFESIEHWNRCHFIYDALRGQESSHKLYNAASGYHILVLADLLSMHYTDRPPHLPFDKVAYWLANCLSQKWHAESRRLLAIINKGIAGKMLDGGLEFKPSSWFVIEVANKGFNLKIDYSDANYPTQLIPYKDALNRWDTNDLDELDLLVTVLCEHHLKNASYGDGVSTADIQFGDSTWFVYAFEVLAWLSIREQAGLQNPPSFSHPLMGLSLNKLPKSSPPMPISESFNKVASRLSQLPPK